MPPERTFWVPERLAKLRELAEHLSASLIAAEIGDGATRSAVIGACHRYGVILKANRPGMTTTKLVEKRDRQARQRARKLQMQEPAKMTYTPERFKPKPSDPPTIRAVPFMQLEEWHCREIVGHDGSLALYCGARKFKGTSYCRTHAQRNTPGLFAKYVNGVPPDTTGSTQAAE